MVKEMKIKAVSEEKITRYILKRSIDDWLEYSYSDVVIVGAGPSGLTAAFYLAKAGLKTLVLEKKVTVGGGMGGGGNLFHKILVAEPANNVLDDIGARYEQVEDGLYMLDSAQLIAKLLASASDAGVKMIFGVQVEDVIYRRNPLRLEGVVAIWSAIPLAQLHVDPINIRSKVVVDATGHDAEIARIVEKKVPSSGIKVQGEKSMWAEEGEKFTVEYTREIIPGLFATGMAVNAIFGGPRMGPIFSGMLLSGKKVADLIIKKLKG